MLLAPFRGGRALMFRLATYKNNYLTDVEATVTLALHVPEGDKRTTKFYPLALGIAHINALAMNWTVVHPIDELSPLFGIKADAIKAQRAELIVSIKAFDDHFSNTVQQRSSYTHEELVCGARFLPMFERSAAQGLTILELDKINAYEAAELPPADTLPGAGKSL
jgi:inward rectifier potassium channel